MVNSLDDIADSMNSVLQKRNLPTHETNCYKTFIGNGLRNLVRTTLPESRRDDLTINVCLEEMMVNYGDNCLVKTGLYDGISHLLDELVIRKIKLSIFSNKADALTKKIAVALLNQWPFEVIAGMTTEVRKKPDASVPLEICKKFELQPAEILFVGDSGIDVQTAKNAGMPAAGVLWGFRSADELKESGADHLLAEPKELFHLLESSGS